ncbi:MULTISPECIES: SMI1/KNR4 family protein [Pseudomonas]|uniref:SMI1/KNR4 family protein n=1 Tax=Pseudomonas quercus TaxID=2722792 RepID=A0ABX0YGD0_9PSED|nr:MULTISPECIES: SMI1/KNR4 family protein [Pseudomonas]MBF7142711.1 SMI1/KNR4 family protein [Pseudomonas sp. LY10J]NJP01249.1 SMI1/KNR4 family protein [Pseudomonas quercus]
MVDMMGSKTDLSEVEFLDFESSFNSVLPARFKTYYLKKNGGFPSEEDVESGRWGLPVNGFYSIKYGNLKISDVIESIKEISPLSSTHGTWSKGWFVPFAYDSGGNSIFISLRKIDYGFVYIYAQDGDNLLKISESFDDFLVKLGVD